MKAKELREKSPEALRELEASIRTSFFQNRMKNYTNQLDDTSAIRKARKELARLLTVQNEKARAQTTEGAAE